MHRNSVTDAHPLHVMHGLISKVQTLCIVPYQGLGLWAFGFLIPRYITFMDNWFKFFTLKSLLRNASTHKGPSKVPSLKSLP